MIRYKKNELLVVDWIDAETIADWVDEVGSTTPPSALFRTAGFYSGKDKKFFYLSWSIGLEKNYQRSKDSIPLGCITKIERVKY